MSADIKCNTNEWKQFDSDWKPLQQLKSNTYETLIYTEKDWINFVQTTATDLKDDVVDKCGEDWFIYFKRIKRLKDFPVSVNTNRVFIKFILTDFEDNVSEKIIEFKMSTTS